MFKVLSILQKNLVWAIQIINFVLIPIIAYFTGKLFFSGGPEKYALWAVGLFLIGVLPTSGMTISWAGFARGNKEAAIKMVIFGLIIGALAAPIYTKVFMGATIEVNMLHMFKQIALFVFVPMIVGRLFFHRGDAIAMVFGVVMRDLSIALAIAMTAFGKQGFTIALLIALAYIIQIQSAAWYVKLVDTIFGKPMEKADSTKAHVPDQALALNEENVQVRIGNPVKQILSTARKGNYDLVIIGGGAAGLTAGRYIESITEKDHC